MPKGITRVSGLPDPLIYGTAFPDLRLVMRDGRQLVESRSNDNLRTDTSIFDAQGTVRMAELLLTDLCTQAHAECDGWCPLVADRMDHEDEETGELIEWGVWHDRKPNVDSCPELVRLLQHCQTEAQRRFFRLWCETGVRPLSGGWSEGLHGGDQLSWSAVSDRFAFPALIPEVWLNYLGPSKTADDELHCPRTPSAWTS